MASRENVNNEHIATIHDMFRSLDRRIRILEAEIGIKPGLKKTAAADHSSEGKLFRQKQEGIGIESGFGEYGLAWIGNIVLLFGITFLMQYIQNKGYNMVSSLFGYVVVAGLFLLYHLYSSNNSFIGFGFLLLK